MEAAHQGHLNWHTKALPRKTLKALESLKKAGWLKKQSWYLAGGTALALQMGHRRSVDLDFFCPLKTFKPQEVISQLPENSWKPHIVKEGTLYGTIHEAKVSFIAYPFFVPKESFVHYGDIPVLRLSDIAVMKIIAISQRGKKRDFIDLYWLLHHGEHLQTVLQKLPAQYPSVAHDYYHLLKSLTFFDDAEGDPMPTLYFKANWNEIKAYFRKEVPQVARALLRI